jgi:hypothetical protein
VPKYRNSRPRACYFRPREPASYSRVAPAREKFGTYARGTDERQRSLALPSR